MLNSSPTCGSDEYCVWGDCADCYNPQTHYRTYEAEQDRLEWQKLLEVEIDPEVWHRAYRAIKIYGNAKKILDVCDRIIQDAEHALACKSYRPDYVQFVASTNDIIEYKKLRGLVK
jgi:hypothetical protein